MTSRQSRRRHDNGQVRVNIDAMLVAIFRICYSKYLVWFWSLFATFFLQFSNKYLVYFWGLFVTFFFTIFQLKTETHFTKPFELLRVQFLTTIPQM